MKEENKILRKLLWLNHGHMELYGDDGEMQCSRCMLDFKRDSISKIEKVFTEIALNKVREYLHQS
jgi:hypothetical protein